ncbi:TonB-dependent receptor [Parabacteroides sp. AF18-52]|uniref:SusC/RagA family TonB-linked outer membrane protein n=1 Tax=Parabacteroides sp. AF18-52 TaxID=2292242 RepID=UPI001F43BB41|nr:TonB-dependent receptor [Parabacteroides sp. AF18-52]
MKRENFRRMRSWNAAFALLFLFSTAESKADTGKGSETFYPTIEENVGVTITQQNERTIKGVVKDATGETVIGANVSVLGTTTGTVTDVEGNFSLKVPVGATLKISFIGYKDFTVKITNQQSLDVILQDDSQALDEVVVVGFGTQKKVNQTGSVAVVDAKKLQSRPVATVTEAMQGLVPGMNFSYGGSGGAEINQNMKINIRGTGTIGTGSSASPLVLIDGMEGDMNVLNPNDIETISVLKDAAASSIYGSRAPFGVVLITTKKGKAGKVSINYNNNFRWTKAINMPHVADSYTFAQYFNRAAVAAGDTPAFDDDTMKRIEGYQNGTFTDTTIPSLSDPNTWDWVGNSNNDWYDLLFGNTAFSQEHSLSMNGGSEKFQYYLSGNFMDENGLMSYRPDNMKRYTMTAKINAELFPWLHVNYNTKFMRKDYDKTSYLGNQLYHELTKRWPTEPVLDPNGYILNDQISGLVNSGSDNTQTDWLYQQFQVVLEPIKGWKIFGEINYKTIDQFWHKHTYKLPKWQVDGSVFYKGGFDVTSAEESAERTNFFNPNVYTEYMKSFGGGHTMKVMVGFQAEQNKYRKLGAKKNDLITDNVPNISQATGQEKITDSKLEHWATAGFFGRVNYDYKERYLLEVNLRYDGTSRFAEDKRWNLFPSFSVGWNAAREEFMQPYEHIINTLKFRGSWGELGNQNTESLYPYMQLMKFTAADKDGKWLINNQRPNTSNAPDLVSALLGWETMRSWNIGVDLGFIQNRLTMSFDWFNRKTVNMVGPAPELPVILGTAVPKTNNADLLSRGFELDLSWRDQIGEVQYGAHLLLSDDRQKILKYPNETGSLNTWRAGEYMGEIWGFETIGIAKTDQEMSDHLATLPNGGQNEQGSKWAAGDIMYKDLDGDGVIHAGETITAPGDLKIIGNSTPRFKFGIDLDAAWKGFDIRVFLQGVAKRDYWLDGNMMFGASGGKWGSTVFTEHMDFFRQEGDAWGTNLDGYFPRPNFEGDKNQKKQTRYLQNAAYCRLKNFQIGYTIPSELTRRIGVQNLRLFFSADNLFTLTSLPNSFDPETLGTGYGADNNTATSTAKTYPLSRTISTGFSVNF